MGFTSILIRPRGKAPTFSARGDRDHASGVTSGAFRPKMLRMKHRSVVAAVLIIGGFAGCNLKEKYARNNFAADQWLQANVGAAGVNVEGAWEA